MSPPDFAALPAVDTGLTWNNSFAALGPAFFTRLEPRPLPAPCFVAASPGAAALLGLDAGWLQSDAALRLFSGNALPQGGDPLASVYSGHQFGIWAGQLGDGRALLLGEAQTPQGPQEIQLKGSGLTPYSRMGDGRAVLRSSIREFLCSEAMHALGIPTTRALYLCGSPEPVRREAIETAAVVTRVAPSFIRFGHFEHFAARGQFDELRQLADYVIARFYPECLDGAGFGGNPYAALLQAVSERTAALVAQWQAVGFCHGVLNTDNMSILGLTIDYGPFQFLDAFDPGHICNHSDQHGRYAFGQQPGVVYWNLYRLGQALQPLIGDPAIAMAALESFKALYPAEFIARMRAKLGLATAHEDDAPLIDAILHLLTDNAVDYPIFWRRLSHAVAGGDFEPVRDLFADRAGLDRWLLAYQEHAALDGRTLEADLMLRSNPRFVLRNHLGEQAIRAAEAGNFSEVHTLQALLEHPFDEHPGFEAHAGFPPDWAQNISISCSS
ncbi:protein adenylyltransferase SelO family protein [Simplicispira lacusdiani]|uniref:protein adenylyltransferase SelO family protein n=1 Tax=Simplicispira lacusdiani TaxID=2213010 RepID=UPI000E731F0E|nr:YdiU family protein [Simplicispira lacusdiani]